MKRVGVIGGGQLAWMMADAAQKLGVELVVQTPSEHDPAVSIAKETVFAPVDDATATEILAQKSHVITFENEFVNLDSLSILAHQGVCFRPRLEALAPLLDKYHQRCYLRDLGLPVPQFLALDEVENIKSKIEYLGFPAVLKSRRHGYDGQGTFIIQDFATLEQKLSYETPTKTLNQSLFLLEEFVPFERELAIIAARSVEGEIVTYPVVETQQEQQVCRRVIAPAQITPNQVAEIQAIARTEWVSLVEAIEKDEIVSELALRYLLSQLLNQADNFRRLASQTIGNLTSFLGTTIIDKGISLSLILRHINQSDYAARLMEIAMHSLMQAMQEYQAFPNSLLKPLSQMRSANKKHGNVGDIELLEDRQIVEAWDAKYGKSYLRDEIEELSEKLEVHPAVRKAGFVTSLKAERIDELMPRCNEIEEIFGISLEIVTFEEWVELQFAHTLAEEVATEQELASAWLIAYTESLAQQRRDIAPIDEPCYQWLFKLNETLRSQ